MKRALVCLLATFAACEHGAKKPTAKAPPAKLEKLPGETDLVRITLTAEAEQRLGIDTAAVARQTVARRRTFAGEVVLPPGAALMVTAPVGGTVRGVEDAEPPTAGAAVGAQQAVLTLAPLPAPESHVTFATAVANAEGEVGRTLARQTAAEIAHRRAAALLAEQAGSVRAVDDAQAELEQATAAVDAARATLARLTTALDEFGSDATSLPLTAPIAGRIRSLLALPGQRVAAGAPLFEVIDTTHPWVRVAIPVVDAGTVGDPERADLGPLGGGSEARPASHVAAPPSADPLSDTVHLFFAFDNADDRYRPGERVGVTLPFGDGGERLVLPWSAIVHDVQGGAWVYENPAPQTFVRRRVALDWLDGDVAVLGRGPAVGTRVAVTGVAELFGIEFGGGK